MSPRSVSSAFLACITVLIGSSLAFPDLSTGLMIERGPGQSRWRFQATASSEDKASGQTAQNAIDGDPKTIWGAAVVSPDEWLMLDLGSAIPVESIEIDWEYPDKEYGFVVEWSNEGNAWNRLASGSSKQAQRRITISAGNKFLRVRVTDLPPSIRAGIREIHLRNAAGGEIRNRRLDGQE